MSFQHIRHKPPSRLSRTRELLLVCAPMRSGVNLARIVRAAGCCGILRIICCGSTKIRSKIARDGADAVELEVHRSLPPILVRLKAEGYLLIGLEQTTGSHCLYDFNFPRKAALVIGNERTGLDEQTLDMLDQVVEIPVYGMPYSHNVATATVMAMYEYCRQYPSG